MKFFTFKELRDECLYGSFAGLGVIITGYPFDTMKTRMQMDNSGLIQVVKEQVAKEGLFAFYKGVGGPLVAVPALNAVIFATYQISFNIMKDMNGYQGNFNPGLALLAGCISGVVNSPIVCASELVKCKMQMQKTGNKEDKNVYDCFVKQIKKNGVQRGSLQGNVSTIWREVPAYGAQFYVYEKVKNIFSKYNESKGLSGETTLFQSFLSGGCAGFGCWLFSYPQDCVKTRIQCNDIGHYKSVFGDGGTFNAHKDIWKSLGPRGFWVGFSAVCGRAIIGNSFGFLFWEVSKLYL